jgi:hypothetical protein
MRPVYLPFGILGPGWYSLGDDYTADLIFPQPPPSADARDLLILDRDG